MIKLARGEPYPLPVPQQEGASANFLSKNGNVLQVSLPGMTANECTAFRSGMIKAGFMYQDGSLLWLFQFNDNKGRPLITLDAPFDVRLIPKNLLALHSIDNAQQRLLIDLHAIDEHKILRALRVITMPPELTLEFLQAAQDQMASIDRQGIMERWMQLSPDTLAVTTKMYLMGK